MPFVSVRGIEINYRDEGRGFPVLLLHGLSDTLMLWDPLIPELSGHYRIVAMDIRGHGYSGKPDGPYSIQMFSEDLHEFLDKLEIPKAHLLGLSMGGSIAQQFTIDYSERVASLILLSSFYGSDASLLHKFENLKKALTEIGLAGFYDEAVKLVVSPDFASVHAKDIADMRKTFVKVNSQTAILSAIDACSKFDVGKRISQISVPTLILSGSEDVFVPPYLAEQIHQAIKGSEWHNLSGVGHNLIIPEKIYDLMHIVLEFLNR
jgi:3-oxoadipate enol-lactonase